MKPINCRIKALLHYVRLDNHFIITSTLIDCLKEFLLAIKDIVSTPTSSMAGFDSLEKESRWQYTLVEILSPGVRGVSSLVQIIKIDRLA